MKRNAFQAIVWALVACLISIQVDGFEDMLIHEYLGLYIADLICIIMCIGHFTKLIFSLDVVDELINKP